MSNNHVPAYFDDAQRAALTKSAAPEEAGASAVTTSDLS